MPQSSSALARKLDRMRMLYPHGVPQAALRGAPAARVACAFVVIAPEASLPADQEAVLASICTKALGLARDSCRFRIISLQEDSSNELQALSAAPVTVVFGGGGRKGEVLEADGRVVLRTHSLNDICGVPQRKREAWGHLQGILGVLRVA